MLASLIALRKAMLTHGMKHAVSFHKSIKRAASFRLYNDLYTGATESGELETFHVTGATPSSVRKRITTEFANSTRSLITNARCLTEGVDIPNIDCVLFADPKRSTVDIVQAVGRALRPAKDKRCGYVLVPVISRDEKGEAFVESEAFASSTASGLS
jgi:predicted helicase